MSQHPLGLAGGLNLYQHTPSPLSLIDPLGLRKCDPEKWDVSSHQSNKMLLKVKILDCTLIMLVRRIL
nr:hypothetical protein [Pantoea dispersa]